MTLIDKIRAEIKKLQDIFVETAQGMETEDEATVYSMCAVEFGDELLSFLDTLPDEPVTDCHDLTEAAEKSARQYYVDGGYSPFPNTETASHIAGFKAGAEWAASYLRYTPKKVSEDLEEAARAFVGVDMDCDELYEYEIGIAAFKEGAEWQYQKDRGEFAKIKAKTWCEGFDACKEQMMEGAVEGVVWGNVGKNINISVLKGVCKYLEQDEPTYKVRIIILPKEEDNDRTLV